MQVTTEGQVTIPQYVRKRLGLVPQTEIDFVEENGRFYIIKLPRPPQPTNKFRRFRGIATVKMRTDDILQLTRGEE